jgi:hypothetical protein
VQNQVWQEKKHFSIDAYRINSDPHDIMAEVYKNGPVEVAFTVYEVMSSCVVSSSPCIFSTNFEAETLWTIGCRYCRGQTLHTKT